jgi:hypothetical protein
MKIKRAYKRISPEEIREIKAAVKLGADVKDVAKQYNTTPDTVENIPKTPFPSLKPAGPETARNPWTKYKLS